MTCGSSYTKFRTLPSVGLTAHPIIIAKRWRLMADSAIRIFGCAILQPEQSPHIVSVNTCAPRLTMLLAETGRIRSLCSYPWLRQVDRSAVNQAGNNMVADAIERHIDALIQGMAPLPLLAL